MKKKVELMPFRSRHRLTKIHAEKRKQKKKMSNAQHSVEYITQIGAAVKTKRPQTKVYYKTNQTKE